MGIRGLKTMLVNKTGQRISFDVEDGGTCPLRDLPAGKSQSVSLSRICKCCRERGSPNWSIRVLINGHFHGMRLHPRHHILKMTRIGFRYNWNGSSVLMAEGVMENFFDRMFDDCCINWKRRIYVEIAEADSTWRGTVSSQEPNIVVGTSALRNGNNERLSSSQEPNIVVGTSALRNGNNERLSNQEPNIVVGTSALRNGNNERLSSQEPNIVVGTSALRNGNNERLREVGDPDVGIERRKRLYRLLSLRRRDMFNRFLLFALAFVLVAAVRFRIWLCV